MRVLQGDCRDLLKTLPDASVQCVVTSPPYFGLRDYGTATWDGGDPACDHREPPSGATNNKGNNDMGHVYRGSCKKCGAVRIDSQIGLEASPDAFVAEMVAVFREVRRVLRDDGTLWLNLGDSYASIGGGYSETGNRGCSAVISAKTQSAVLKGRNRNGYEGLKTKDLMMIPARVALALQADGWWLRSDIIWAKPNPMHESIRDRPTSAHEHVFLLTKSARYFYDADAVREEGSDHPVTIARNNRADKGLVGAQGLYGLPQGQSGNGTYIRKVKVPGGWDQGEGAHGTIHRSGRTEAAYQEAELKAGRNLRNVWTIATQPFSEAHFATFPPELAERCIKAGSRPGDTILDPFAGAFTSLLVADRLQRHGIGIELNPEYCAMARRRIEQDAGMFADIA